MSDLIFIGPQAAGKTTLFMVLQGKEPPIRHNATQSNGRTRRIRTSAKKGFCGLWRGRVSIIDTGGKDSEFDRYRIWCNQANKVVVVFNGVELLKEINEPEKGGMTSSFIKRSLMEINGESNSYFVATFADEYVKKYCPENESEDDIEKGRILERTILNRIVQVNEKYKEICEAPRYPMYDQMQGRLWGVNALNQSAVKSVFSEILKKEP